VSRQTEKRHDRIQHTVNGAARKYDHKRTQDREKREEVKDREGCDLHGVSFKGQSFFSLRLRRTGLCEK